MSRNCFCDAKAGPVCLLLPLPFFSPPVTDDAGDMQGKEKWRKGRYRLEYTNGVKNGGGPGKVREFFGVVSAGL